MYRLALVLIVVAAVGLGAAQSAFACTAAATLTLSGGSPSVPPAFRPGDAVTVTGTKFGTHRGGTVSVREGSAGPSLGKAVIDAKGSWTLSFTLPADVTPGTHVLFADAGDVEGFMVTVAFVVPAPAVAKATQTTSPSLPWLPLALGGAALVVLLAAAAAGTLSLRLRRRAQLAQIEAELQQLLAEESARTPVETDSRTLVG